MIKKYLFFISLLLFFPLTAHAVPAPVAMLPLTIETAIKQFSPPFCQNGLQGLASAVEKCYQNTKDTSVTMDMCILGDITIAKILIQDKKADLSILDRKPSEVIADKNIPVSGTESYLNFASVVKRLQMLGDMPRFYIYNSPQILAYLQQGADPVYKGITGHCKK
ncbi:hypothetical protein [Commensalibacter nepenthis]|uniref:Uncharacterized protein n=1 Tax=Commensalibacter nepenthis TaxID=3043872 RepID=A0ABT6Q5I8_9PROT|nr:hypothetical protein [Commensalibacter sp. TBRC 10068]MDI2112165.1 hypothetical protein [Commensalibacter sp. TBRC 10068]